MKKLYLVLSIGTLVLSSSATALSQSGDVPPPPPPAVGFAGSAQDEPRLSESLASRLEGLPDDFEITRADREEAYAKLLEGQRYLWSLRRLRATAPGIKIGARMAKTALLGAVELDPKLAEGYTALAELTLTSPPQDLDEAIGLSEIAVKLDKDNFGGYRFLGRLYTIKSNLGRGKALPEFAAKAISAWKEIGRLDPRNAEAWAFLSAFYEASGQEEERIDALRFWLASAAPVEQGFYSRVMRDDAELTPEAASTKLGSALLELGRSEEALEILSRAISDDPGNLEAVDMLGQALEDVPVGSMSPVIEALRQAVYANPDNFSLNQLLADTLLRSGKAADGAKVLETAAARAADKEGKAASTYLVALGDLYLESGNSDAAVDSYKRALKARKIGKGLVQDDDDREFAGIVIGKEVNAEARVERYGRALEIINQSRDMFGISDLTLDRELIRLYRNKGDREAALAHVKSLRTRAPKDYNLIRTEASILTDLGRVEEAVVLIRQLIDSKPPAETTPSVMYDDFINYVFISSLYNQAKESRKAIEAATNAFSEADGDERRQIAKLALASAQQTSGDFQSAEKNLREILDDSPKNPIALNNLGYLFLETGKNFEEALEYVRGAVKIDPKNSSYLDSLGWAYFKLGKLELAEHNLRKALRYAPTSATIMEHLGDILKARGKTSEADEVWSRALKYVTMDEDTLRITKKLGR